MLSITLRDLALLGPVVPDTLKGAFAITGLPFALSPISMASRFPSLLYKERKLSASPTFAGRDVAGELRPLAS